MELNKTIKVSVLGLWATVAVSCHKNDNHRAGQEPAISVTTEEIKMAASGDLFVVSGNIEGMKTVKTGFQVAGRIAGINGEEGSMIRKGSEIAWLDPTNYAIAKELADVQVAQVTDEFNRINILHERNSVSESDFMKCKYTLDGAIAQQKLRAKDLSDTKLYAPISGILLKKMGEAGEMISAGMPVLVISDISKVKVNAYIPENRLKDIKIGQEVEIRIDAIDAVRHGKIAEVGGMADPTTRSFTVKAIVDNPDDNIRPGMIATVTFTASDSIMTATVNSAALLRTPDGQPYVYVADKERKQAFRRNISIGAVRDNRIEVSSGLEAGETVVVGGTHKLSNGSSINITK